MIRQGIEEPQYISYKLFKRVLWKRFIGYRPVSRETIDILNLVKASEGILEQYMDAAGGKENAYIIDLLRDIATLKSRIVRIHHVIESLKLEYSQSLADTLLDCGILQPITPETDLDKVQQQIKMLEGDLERRQKEYEGLNKKGDKPSREVFERIMVQVDPKINAKDITTYRFCILFNDLKRKADGQRKGR